MNQFQTSTLTPSSKENFEKIQNSNPRHAMVLQTLYEYDTNLFTQQIIEMIKKIGLTKEFTLVNLLELTPLVTSAIFEGYLKETDKAYLDTLIKVYIESIANTYQLGSMYNIYTKFMQLLNIKVTPIAASPIGHISNVKAIIKYPDLKPIPNIAITADIENMFNASILANNVNIINTPTELFIFNPGSEKIVYGEPLIQSVIRAMVNLQLLMNQHNAEYLIKINNFIDIDNSQKN